MSLIIESHPIAKFLKEKNMSRKAFCILIGITEAHLSYCLAGKRRLGIDNALKASRIMGITLEEFYNESK